MKMCYQILYLHRTFTRSLTQKYYKNSNWAHIFATQTSPANDLESWLRLWWKLTASTPGSSPRDWNVISLHQIPWSHQTTCESTQGSLPSSWLPCQTQTQEDRQHLRWTRPWRGTSQQDWVNNKQQLTVSENWRSVGFSSRHPVRSSPLSPSKLNRSHKDFILTAVPGVGQTLQPCATF